MGPDIMMLVFWMLNSKPAFQSSLSPPPRGFLVHLHFLPLEWYPLHIWLLIFLPAILITPCDSSSLAFHTMYSVYNWNEQRDNIQPGHTVYLEPDCSSMSGSNFCFLTCIQISQEAGTVVWYPHLFKNFLSWSTQSKALAQSVSKAEVDVFLEFSAFSMI